MFLFSKQTKPPALFVFVFHFFIAPFPVLISLFSVKMMQQQGFAAQSLVFASFQPNKGLCPLFVQQIGGFTPYNPQSLLRKDNGGLRPPYPPLRGLCPLRTPTIGGLCPPNPPCIVLCSPKSLHLRSKWDLGEQITRTVDNKMVIQDHLIVSLVAPLHFAAKRTKRGAAFGSPFFLFATQNGATL